jgi:hypothetical protein
MKVFAFTKMATLENKLKKYDNKKKPKFIMLKRLHFNNSIDNLNASIKSIKL